MAFTTSNENYAYKQIHNEPDFPDFVEAMQKETKEHEDRGHWTMILRSDKPPDAKTIMSIWSFKRLSLIHI